MLNIPLMDNNILQEDKEAVIDFLRASDRLTNGPKVVEFEEAWSQWLGVKHSVFVHSGSAANFITMAVLRELYGPGEVIVPPITWSSDLSSVFAAGFIPIFADVNLDNLAMNEDAILERINENTRAVFLTHVLGFNGLSKRLLEELKSRGIILIEDVCESHGASMDGCKCGTFGLASNFSFYYAHHMSTIEGGMICTNDDSFYQMCRLYRSHGLIRESTDEALKTSIRKKYPDVNPEFLFALPGYNMRSTEINAVIGLNQLTRLDKNNARRTENFSLFLNHLDPGKYFTDFSIQGSVNYAFVVLLQEASREKYLKLTELLRAENVEFRRGTVGGNMARQPFVRQRMPAFDPTSLINAERIHFYSLYTGNYPTLDKYKILKLCNLLNQI